MTREGPASTQRVSGWKSKTHKRYISKDWALLKQLEVAHKGNEQTRKYGNQFKCNKA